jgi:predicted transcriptional regulator
VKNEKKQVSFRLSESIINDMDEIAKKQNVTRTDVLVVLVQAYAQGEDAVRLFKLAQAL